MGERLERGRRLQWFVRTAFGGSFEHFEFGVRGFNLLIEKRVFDRSTISIQSLISCQLFLFSFELFHSIVDYCHDLCKNTEGIGVISPCVMGAVGVTSLVQLTSDMRLTFSSVSVIIFVLSFFRSSYVRVPAISFSIFNRSAGRICTSAPTYTPSNRTDSVNKWRFDIRYSITETTSEQRATHILCPAVRYCMDLILTCPQIRAC